MSQRVISLRCLPVVGAFAAAVGVSAVADAKPRRSLASRVERVTLQTASGQVLSALACAPEAVGSAPVVMYHHGIMVEHAGDERAAERGYDVAEFAAAFCDAGFVALAPIRPAGSVGEDGIVEAGLDYLRAQPVVDPARLFLVGFSRGGLFALDGAIRHPGAVAGLVLMSPAPGTGAFSWDALATNDHLQRLTMPVLVTLGAEEENPEIVRNVTQLVDELRALGAPVTARLDYPGDHRWFHQVRAAYWEDLVAFLHETANVQ